MSVFGTSSQSEWFSDGELLLLSRDMWTDWLIKLVETLSQCTRSMALDMSKITDQYM